MGRVPSNPLFSLSASACVMTFLDGKIGGLVLLSPNHPLVVRWSAHDLLFSPEAESRLEVNKQITVNRTERSGEFCANIQHGMRWGQEGKLEKRKDITGVTYIPRFGSLVQGGRHSRVFLCPVGAHPAFGLRFLWFSLFLSFASLRLSATLRDEATSLPCRSFAILFIASFGVLAALGCPRASCATSTKIPPITMPYP